MSHTKSIVVLAGAALGFSGVATAQSNTAWSSANADEVRAIVAEMMSDAETRSSLLQSGATAGHDGKFFLASPDGNFRLNVSGQVQFRHYMNFSDGPSVGFNGATHDSFEAGFQTRRTKLQFEGHIFDPNLFYRVLGAYNRNGGNFQLEDAFVGYRFGNGWHAKWGQFKLPFLREESNSSTMMLAVDRSLTNNYFTQGRSQAIEVGYTEEMWKAMFAFSDGFRSSNSEFDTNPADFGFTGRFEFLVDGDWGQFRDYTSPRGSNFGLLLGAAMHYERGADRFMQAPTSHYDFLGWTVDATVQGDGWNIYGAYIGSYNDVHTGGNFTDHGFVVQGGAYLTDEFELFGRYDILIPDSGVFNDNINSITAGFNYYLHGHAAKFTMDVVWVLDETVAVDPITGASSAIFGNQRGLGLLGSSEENEVVVRTQFQLLF
jgi:hypothetical protein